MDDAEVVIKVEDFMVFQYQYVDITHTWRFCPMSPIFLLVWMNMYLCNAYVTEYHSYYIFQSHKQHEIILGSPEFYYYENKVQTKQESKKNKQR